jgi:hypothetical protein
MGLFSGIVQAGAAKKAAQAEARIREQEARSTAKSLRKNATMHLASMEATAAARGLEVSGSVLDRVSQNAAALEQEALDVERFGAQAAALARQRGSNQATAALIGGATSTVQSVFTLGRSIGVGKSSAATT